MGQEMQNKSMRDMVMEHSRQDTWLIETGNKLGQQSDVLGPPSRWAIVALCLCHLGDLEREGCEGLRRVGED